MMLNSFSYLLNDLCEKATGMTRSFTRLAT